MYSLTTPLAEVAGIGPKTQALLAKRELLTCQDLLLCLPLRYVDRSHIATIAELSDQSINSCIATVGSVSTFYKNRRRIDSATARDATGSVKLIWFNNAFIKQSLKSGHSYMISGIRKNGTIVQPTLELLKDDTEMQDLLHTGRLVPLYSSTIGLQQGSLRRVLRRICENITITSPLDTLQIEDSGPQKIHTSLETALRQLHFPDSPDAVISGRERLALEELIGLIQKSHAVKEYWKTLAAAPVIHLSKPHIPTSLPFTLTGAQKRSTTEILTDLTSTTPMNRTLIGDVGSGKTVVAGMAAQQVVNSGYSAALVAPTQILAQQHFETIAQLFNELPITLVTAHTRKKQTITATDKPRLYIGTHAILSQLLQINPALIIYDEQHRFGVLQRSQATQLEHTPHILNMSATPIPRSLMLTVFSHVAVSSIDELPSNRIPTKTWLVPPAKQASAYDWIVELHTTAAAEKPALTLVICPFIDPSNSAALENIASVKEMTEKVMQTCNKKTTSLKKPPLRIGVLHGRMKKTEQANVIAQARNNELDIIVTTPIVEVGVDLPTATAIIITDPQRFGMASLHQLRGRVGRAGQQGYCLLFTPEKLSSAGSERLNNFSRENNGLRLAELDLQNRGSGELFGTEQTGFSALRFANWSNLELIAQAHALYKKLPAKTTTLFTTAIDDSKPLLAN